MAAAGIAVPAVLFAHRSAAQCTAMEGAVARLAELDAACAGSKDGPLHGVPRATPAAGVEARCMDGRAVLSVTPVFPVLPAVFVQCWYDRVLGRWRLRD